MLKTLLLLLAIQVVLSEAKSSKKGVAATRKVFKCGDFDILNGISWWYNWGSNGDMGCGREEPGFVPMLWNAAVGTPQLNQDTVLGFNEPNFSAQSNISPQDAAKKWKEVERAYPGKTLVAPAPAPGGNNMSPTDWYDQFFAACNNLGGCKVDYLATHSYSGNVDGDLKYINDLCKRYNKKVWFTEFAVPNTRDVGKVFDYMGSMLYHLERNDCVHRYAWFMAKWDVSTENSQSGSWYLDSVNSLFIPGTSTLSELGKFYNSYQP